MEKKKLEIRYFDPDVKSKEDYIQEHTLDENPIMPRGWNLTWVLSEHFRDTLSVLENNPNVSSVRIMSRLNEQWFDDDEEGTHYNFDASFRDGEEPAVAVFGFDLLGLRRDALNAWASEMTLVIKQHAGLSLFRLDVAETREHITVFMPRLGDLSKSNRRQRLDYLKLLSTAFLELRVAIADSSRFIGGPSHRSTLGGLEYPFEGVDTDLVDVLVVGSEDWVVGHNPCTYAVAGGRAACLEDIVQKAEEMDLNGYHLSHIAVFNKEAFLLHQEAQEAELAGQTFEIWVEGGLKDFFPRFVGTGKGRTFLEVIGKYIEEERRYVPLKGFVWNLFNDDNEVYGTFNGYRVFATHADAVNYTLTKMAKLANEQRGFELWVEGYSVTGQSAGAEFLGQVRGLDFNTAVAEYVKTLDFDAASYWAFGHSLGHWTRWGCRVYDNEADARRAFG